MRLTPARRATSVSVVRRMPKSSTDARVASRIAFVVGSVTPTAWPKAALRGAAAGLGGEERLDRGPDAGAVARDEADARAAVQDVVSVQGALAAHGVQDLDPQHVEARRQRRQQLRVAVGEREHGGRLGAVAVDEAR